METETKEIKRPKSIVITGSSRGLGYLACKKLCAPEYDYIIVLCGRVEKKAVKAREDILEVYPEAKDRLYARELDVTSVECIKGFKDWFIEEIGTLDILVNNAMYGPKND